MFDKHQEARALYQEYLAKTERLKVLREHAKRVIAATGGSGKTPVEPLATMGPGGGPLLCDVCLKPMILEGGGYQGVYADAAWAKNPQKGWVSYISGGMLLVTEINGTLRVYHGHPHGDGCVSAGDKKLQEARDEFNRQNEGVDAMAKLDLLQAYFEDEHPSLDDDEVLSNIYKVLFKFDPGPGVNVP